MKSISISLTTVFILLCGNVRAEGPFLDLPVYAGWAFANAKEEPSSDAEKVQLILDNGYEGFMGCKIQDPESVKKFGVTLPGLYFQVMPDTETFEVALQRLESQLPLLSKKEGAVWLFFTRNAETPANDANAVAMLQRFSDWSRESGYAVSLYAHRESEKKKFYWPHSERCLSFIEQSGADNLGLVFTVYHERFNGFEKDILARFDAVAERVTTVALFGPEMIKRKSEGDPFYDNLLGHLENSGYDKPFLIYSRNYSEHASVYLKAQKDAFEFYRKRAAP